MTTKRNPRNSRQSIEEPFDEARTPQVPADSSGSVVQPVPKAAKLAQRAAADPRLLTVPEIQRFQQLAGNQATARLLGHQVPRQPVPRPYVQRMPIKPLWKMQLPSEKKAKYLEIIGDARTTDSFTPAKLKELFDFFEATGLPVFNDAINTLVAEYENRTVAADEQKEKVLSPLELNALSTLGKGQTWKELQPGIMEWWDKLKLAEAGETFGAAYSQNRMSGRQINTAGRGGDFNVKRTRGLGDRQMRLARDVPGIMKRMEPANFYDAKRKSSKNEKGLHDLSASLLDGSKNISEQLKHYEDAVVLFMPLPAESDLQILSALGKLKDRDEAEMGKMKSRLTRVKLAQSSDMGTVYVDIGAKRSAPGKFRYGATGTVIREKGGTGVEATPEELAARATNALEYKKILKDEITTVNEIVMAYRKHESTLFPMFAKWDGSAGYDVLNSSLVKTGHYITDAGKYT